MGKRDLIIADRVHHQVRARSANRNVQAADIRSADLVSCGQRDASTSARHLDVRITGPVVRAAGIRYRGGGDNSDRAGRRISGHQGILGQLGRATGIQRQGACRRLNRIVYVNLARSAGRQPDVPGRRGHRLRDREAPGSHDIDFAVNRSASKLQLIRVIDEDAGCQTGRRGIQTVRIDIQRIRHRVYANTRSGFEDNHICDQLIRGPHPRVLNGITRSQRQVRHRID